MNERRIVCEDLSVALDDLRRDKFCLELIYPADEPHTAVLTRGRTRIRLTSRPEAPPVPDGLPSFVPEFVVTRGEASGGIGRAGMVYRDLIPGRLGGRYVASHILIPDGGPVADWVHFHRIKLQLICVRRGWVRVVYEDQGEPFVMREGDLVLQPPEIRHQVLESSVGVEVVEITAPALHATFSDHALRLPDGGHGLRTFSGQHFVHHSSAESVWTSFGDAEAQETGIGQATASLLEARIVRPRTGLISFQPHPGELAFGFLLEGSAMLEFGGSHELKAADAFVVPPAEPWSLADCSPNLRLLHVTTAHLD